MDHEASARLGFNLPLLTSGEPARNKYMSERDRRLTIPNISRQPPEGIWMAVIVKEGMKKCQQRFICTTLRGNFD
jgi:hypothetical protein